MDRNNKSILVCGDGAELPPMLLLFAMLYSITILMPAIFGYEMLKLGYFLINAGSLVVPLIFMLGDIITELYGYPIYRRLVINSIYCSIFFIVITQILIYLGQMNIEENQAFVVVFQYDYRITLAGVIGLALGSLLNGKALANLKRLTKGRYFGVRSIMASLVGDVFELIFAGVIGYLGILPFTEIVRMMVSVFILRTVAAFILASPSALLISVLKNKAINSCRGIYEFNPFAK